MINLNFLLKFVGISCTILLFSYCENSIIEDPAISQSKEIIEEIILDTTQLHGFLLRDHWVDTSKVEPNQGLSHILPKYGISQATVYKIASGFDTVFDFRNIKAGRNYYMICKNDSSHTPICFIYDKSAVEYIEVHFEKEISVQAHKRQIDTRIQSAGGTINSSLWNAFIDQDLSGGLVMEVAKMYAWTIDFFGIQKGDYFKIIFESKYVEGQFIGTGEIKAILFNHRGHDFYCFKYLKDTLGDFAYYNEKGESMKKALLSAPLEYVRISSKFSNSRLHPILKRYRPHHGVEYAAPKGTDVVATGDGVITHARYSSGAGNYIKMDHTSGDIETKYLHLSKFAKGIKKGVFVKQGQKIGEVGSTGLSTGPHLDYRIYINGDPVDPLGIDIPTSDPITKDSLDTFLLQINPVKMKLDSISLTN